MFVRHSGTIVLIVYLDDILLSGDDSAGIVDLKRYLGQQFHTKDLGALRYFLGIEVARSSRGISLFQRKYVLDLLSETGFLGARPVETPMDSPLSLMLIMAIPFLMWAGIDVWLGNGFISLLLVLWKKKESNGTRYKEVMGDHFTGLGPCLPNSMMMMLLCQIQIRIGLITKKKKGPALD